MRINQEECQYLSVSWFRRIFELEGSHSVLEYIRESKEPSLSRKTLTYLLHFGPILLYAVEFFDTFMIILDEVNDKSSVKTQECFAKSPRRCPLAEGGEIPGRGSSFRIHHHQCDDEKLDSYPQYFENRSNIKR